MDILLICLSSRSVSRRFISCWMAVAISWRKGGTWNDNITVSELPKLIAKLHFSAEIVLIFSHADQDPTRYQDMSDFATIGASIHENSSTTPSVSHMQLSACPSYDARLHEVVSVNLASFETQSYSH